MMPGASLSLVAIRPVGSVETNALFAAADLVAPLTVEFEIVGFASGSASVLLGAAATTARCLSVSIAAGGDITLIGGGPSSSPDDRVTVAASAALATGRRAVVTAAVVPGRGLGALWLDGRRLGVSEAAGGSFGSPNGWGVAGTTGAIAVTGDAAFIGPVRIYHRQAPQTV